MNTKEIAKKTIEYYGREHQLRKLQEECGELVAAIQHYNDCRDNSVGELIGEIADVFFLLMQLRIDIGPHIIDNAIDIKANRQNERINSEKYDDDV